MKQPLLGLAASGVVIAISLGFVSLFPLAAFTTWVSYGMISLIPMLIVIGVTWETKHPGFAARQRQPVRGLLFLAVVLAAGACVALVHFVTVGGMVSPPAPMLSMCIITTVPVAFWLAIIWGGWPFNAIVKSRAAAGCAMLLACYLVNVLLFRAFFNFGFMNRAPEYVAALDPRGWFSAWNALVVYITATAAMFLVLNFELWPFSRKPAHVRQPLLGAVWTAVVLGSGSGSPRHWRGPAGDGRPGVHGSRADTVHLRHDHRAEHDAELALCPVLAASPGSVQRGCLRGDWRGPRAIVRCPGACHFRSCGVRSSSLHVRNLAGVSPPGGDVSVPDHFRGPFSVLAPAADRKAEKATLEIDE